MNKALFAATALLAACSTTTPPPAPTQPPPATVGVAAPVTPPPAAVPAVPRSAAAPARQEIAPPPVTRSMPEGDALQSLTAMTFSCPRAGLNAAAREAAKAPSQGTYQFSYFRIVNDSHHSLYEVGFKSNYHGEPDLLYCVSIYCQQGWDPKKTPPAVTLKQAPAGTTTRGAAATVQKAACAQHEMGKARQMTR